ncbi:DUF1140 family protein [Staphylococcus arlettae]|uniref:DUF1140 family protein n=1 Tax=Staphylococcus arlettae TaxID=29378 RepID=UPI003EE2E2D3
MTPNDLLLRHAHLIVKSLLQRLDKAYKRFLKFSDTSLAAEISTSRHWSAVRGMEQSQEEMDSYIEQLLVMDEYTQWSDKLHQDRYKFVEKYDIAMEKYRGVVKNENKN